MGRCYNVVLDSNYAYIAGATNSSNQFYVNWDGIMPDKPYKVTFSLMTAIEAALDNNIMCLMINLGCNDTYVYKSNGTMTTSNFLGFLELKDTGTTHYYFADTATNAPVYIQNRPFVNQILVQFTNGIDETSIYSTPAIANYILTLHFEEID